MADETLLDVTLTAEEQETENTRLLEAEDEDLSTKDKESKTALLKGQKETEEKRLLDADDKDLSDEDKQKKAALVKVKEDAKEATKGKAPDNYADFTIAEGAQVDVPIMDEFKAVAKKLNLSQEDAQELINLQAKLGEAAQTKAVEANNERKEAWRVEAVKNLGVDSKKELVFANKTIEKFGTPALREFLNETGLGNHTELVSLFVKIGKEAISEDGLVEGDQKTKPKSDAELFYGNTMK